MLKRCIVHYNNLLASRRHFVVSTELEPHRRQYLVGKVGLATRFEALVERSRKHMGRDCLVNRRLECPAPLTGIRHPTTKV